MAEDLSDEVTFNASDNPPINAELTVKLGSDGEVESITKNTLGRLKNYPTLTVQRDGRAVGEDFGVGKFKLQPRAVLALIQLAKQQAPTKAVSKAVERFQTRFFEARKTARRIEDWLSSSGQPTEKPEHRSTTPVRRLGSTLYQPEDHTRAGPVDPRGL